MTAPLQLGRVSSLFPHVKEDWWKDAHNEVYLWTDGDCVENPGLTDTECDHLVRIPRLQEILLESTSHTLPKRALDLCCGQGRHSINLARRYPLVQFYGFDQSAYLVNLARERAIAGKVDTNTTFEVGDARKIPLSEHFDIVLLMGNSFGYCSIEDNEGILHEVSRVLKPGGIFVVDYVDGAWMRTNFTPAGWEWLDSAHVPPSMDHKKLVALREREISPDNKRLASREIVIDLGGPTIHQDLFYSIQLYSLEEMESLLATAGLSILPQDCTVITGPKGEGVTDLGMMEQRQLVVAQKIQALGTDSVEPQEADIYTHPN
ncbi:S-adenosyl-L-methionine-dependent methyltransferase [Aspergillus floccosus]